MKENRKLVGAVPYGYNLVDDTNLEPNYNEQIVIGIMKTIRDQGNSFNRIADHLNSKGIPAKKGGKWYSKTVRSTLKADVTF